jgi:hypothetical protein
MKILHSTMLDVATDDGDIRSVNETIWNYRSECCGCALEQLEDASVRCKLCGEVSPALVHKSVIAAGMAQMRKGIDALPEEFRAAAVGGWYENLSRGLSDPATRQRIVAARVVHIVDRGNGEALLELPEKLLKQ